MAKVIGEAAVAAMERGIEASNLRESRPVGKQRPDRRKIVRLMQRRQWEEPLQPLENPLIDYYGPAGHRWPAMDHAVAHRDGIDLEFVTQPGRGIARSGLEVGHGLIRVGPAQNLAAGMHAARVSAYPLDDAFDLALEPLARSISKTWNLTLEEPALATRIVSMSSLRYTGVPPAGIGVKSRGCAGCHPRPE